MLIAVARLFPDVGDAMSGWLEPMWNMFQSLPPN
jgi:hypothetical protein